MHYRKDFATSFFTKVKINLLQWRKNCATVGASTTGEDMKSQIKHRYTGAVLCECGLPDDTRSGMVTRLTLEKATTNNADLRGADLRGADLEGADLRGADLGGAYLEGADLRGADLGGAYLGGKKLIGQRPIFQIGPIGSRSDYFISYTTDAGIILKAGCFTGTIEEFEAKLTEEHGDNNHAQEYRAALELIKTHATIWKDEK
jgi:Pentapeptide repeats (8 copies)